MTRPNFRALTVGIAIWSAALLVVSGCGGPEDDLTQHDATPPQDTRTPPQDTLNPPQDTLNPPQDTRTPPQDTLNPPQDTLNPPQDTLNPPQDTLNPPACTSPFVWLDPTRRELRLGDDPFFLKSVNYIFDIRHDTQDRYYLAPHHSFCTEPTGCCNDPDTCLAAARTQLAQIKALGFNSLRVVGLAVIPDDGQLVLDCGHQWNTWLDYCPKEARLRMVPPDPRGLALIDQALSLVHEAGLKAIFLTGHHALDALPARDQYTTYLDTFARRYAADPTLIAIDLANEPIYEFADRDVTKFDAHATVQPWYDAIRAAAPHTLVTMGLSEIGTVAHWDPGSMPLDFASFHIYASDNTWGPAVRDYLTTFVAWANREPYPSLVGEAGLSVVPDGPSETQQALFARHILDASWACGMMGLQWWLYRDVDWGEGGFQNGFGLIRRDGTERPALDEFRNFSTALDRPTCSPPSYLGSAPDGTFVVTGRLLQEDGTPIPNGFISGKRCLTGGNDWTISQADGTFELRSTNTLMSLSATASGFSLEAVDLTCGLFAPGDITLHELPFQRRVTPPVACPR